MRSAFEQLVAHDGTILSEIEQALIDYYVWTNSGPKLRSNEQIWEHLSEPAPYAELVAELSRPHPTAKRPHRFCSGPASTHASSGSTATCATD